MPAPQATARGALPAAIPVPISSVAVIPSIAVTAMIAVATVVPVAMIIAIAAIIAVAAVVPQGHNDTTAEQRCQERKDENALHSWFFVVDSGVDSVPVDTFLPNL